MKAQWSKHYLWIVPQLWQWWLSIIKGMTTISGAAPQPQSNWHQERIFPWYSFSSYPTPSTLTRETYFLVRGRLGLDFGSWEASSCSLQLCQCSLQGGWLLMLPRGKCPQRNNFLSFPLWRSLFKNISPSCLCIPAFQSSPLC